MDILYVRSDVKERFDKSIHKDYVERVLVKLHAYIVDVNMAARLLNGMN